MLMAMSALAAMAMAMALGSVALALASVAEMGRSGPRTWRPAARMPRRPATLPPVVRLPLLLLGWVWVGSWAGWGLGCWPGPRLSLDLVVPGCGDLARAGLRLGVVVGWALLLPLLLGWGVVGRLGVGWRLGPRLAVRVVLGCRHLIRLV